MATNNKSDDQVDKITRDEKARIDSDLLNGSLGDRDIQASRSRTNRGRSILVRNEILQKQKEKDEDARREAFKRAQEALEEHLRALEKELDRLYESMRALDELEDLIRAGKFDRNDSHHQSLLQKTGMSADEASGPDALRKTEKLKEIYKERIKEIQEEREHLKEGKNKIIQSDLPDYVKTQKVQELLSQTTSAGVFGFWLDKESAGQTRQEASTVYSETEINIESETAGQTFAQFAGASVAAKAGIGEGIESKAENIKSEFSKAAELGTSERSDDPVPLDMGFKGPKLTS